MAAWNMGYQAKIRQGKQSQTDQCEKNKTQKQ